MTVRSVARGQTHEAVTIFRETVVSVLRQVEVGSPHRRYQRVTEQQRPLASHHQREGVASHASIMSAISRLFMSIISMWLLPVIP